jgi:hypothetical protein
MQIAICTNNPTGEVINRSRLGWSTLRCLLAGLLPAAALLTGILLAGLPALLLAGLLRIVLVLLGIIH